MESGLLPTINSQLIQLESESGARALRRDVLSAISTTLKRYTGSRERENLLLEILNLYNLFMACRPRMSLLIHDLQRLVVFLHEHADADAEALKQYVEVIRREKRAQMERCQTQLIDLLAGQRRVLLHSHSSLSLIHI